MTQSGLYLNPRTSGWKLNRLFQLACFIFPNVGHVIILQRNVLFTFRLILVHIYVQFIKRQRVKRF